MTTDPRSDVLPAASMEDSFSGRRALRVALPLLSLPAVLWTLVACNTMPKIELEEPPPPEPEPEEIEMIPVDGVPMACPEGTMHQEATTEEGTEHWCDADGSMHGPFLRFHPDGEKKTTGAYINDLPDGPWIWWHANGKEEKKGKYVRGKQTGSWTTWYDSGARHEEGDYLQGRRQGTWTVWFESGRKQSSGIYHVGMKSAEWVYYKDDEENTEERREKFENGKLIDDKAKGKKKK